MRYVIVLLVVFSILGYLTVDDITKVAKSRDLYTTNVDKILDK